MGGKKAKPGLSAMPDGHRGAFIYVDTGVTVEAVSVRVAGGLASLWCVDTRSTVRYQCAAGSFLVRMGKTGEVEGR